TMKKAFLSLAILALLAAGCGSEKPAAPNAAGGEQPKQAAKKVALVLPEKIGVNPFFQLMDDGAKKAAKEFGIEEKTIESADHNVIEENLRVAVAEGYDLIIT
ncbi:hypothetical protein MXD63_43165, partial [Frankia sp. Cpl3]|nr:hypothetical protein [Frankia sp. Cpl3]